MFACCAFAVFLLNQLLLPFTAIYRRFAGPASQISESALWEPGKIAMSAPKRRISKPMLVGLVGMELLLLGGSMAVAAVVTGGEKPAASNSDFLKNIPFCGERGAF